VNNYETVEYTLPPPSFPQHTHQTDYQSQNQNTADIYYHDNNDIYLPDDDDLPPSPSKQTNLILTPANFNNKNNKQTHEQPHYLELQSQPPTLPKRSDFPPPPPEATRSHYLNPSNLTQSFLTLQQPPNQYQQRAYNNYSTNSLVNVKYLIDIEDFTAHLTSHKSLETTTVVDQPSTLATHLDQSISSSSHEDTKTPKIVLKCGCIRSCIAFLSFLVNFLSCLTTAVSNCLCRPCCSAAGMLGGVGALGGVMAGAAALGVLGIIPIPVEITRNICQMERERIYNQSLVYLDGSSSSNGSVFNVYESAPNVSLVLFDSTESPISLEKAKKIAEAAEFAETIRLKREKAIEKKLRKLENELRTEGSLVRPLQYDVTLYPGMETPGRQGIEMKVLVSMQFVCRNWTADLVFSTREFATIEMGLEGDGSVAVKKWSYDSAVGRLKVIVSEVFTPYRVYKIGFFIVYKDYGGIAKIPGDGKAES